MTEALVVPKETRYSSMERGRGGGGGDNNVIRTPEHTSSTSLYQLLYTYIKYFQQYRLQSQNTNQRETQTQNLYKIVDNFYQVCGDKLSTKTLQ